MHRFKTMFALKWVITSRRKFLRNIRQCTAYSRKTSQQPSTNLLLVDYQIRASLSLVVYDNSTQNKKKTLPLRCKQEQHVELWITKCDHQPCDATTNYKAFWCHMTLADCRWIWNRYLCCKYFFPWKSIKRRRSLIRQRQLLAEKLISYFL